MNSANPSAHEVLFWAERQGWRRQAHVWGTVEGEPEWRDLVARLEREAPQELNVLLVGLSRRMSETDSVSAETPSFEQARAVRLVAEHFTGEGSSARSMGIRQMPPVAHRWNTSECEARGANGFTTIFSDGSAIITLRTDRSPREIAQTFAHELQHAADTHFALGGFPRGWLEDRAQNSGERLGALVAGALE